MKLPQENTEPMKLPQENTEPMNTFWKHLTPENLRIQEKFHARITNVRSVRLAEAKSLNNKTVDFAKNTRT
jgi:hypothetical protein